MLTKPKVQEIHADIKAALIAVAKKHNLKMSDATKILFNADTFKFTAEFGDLSSAPAGAAAVDPKFLNNMKKHSWKFGLSISDIGAKFEVAPLGMVIMEGMSGTTKCAIRTLGGKGYLMKADQVARKLGKKVPDFMA